MKLTVDLSPYNKENNNLEYNNLNTIKYIRSEAWNKAISLEVRCFIYFNHFSIHKDKPYETIYLWFSISLTPFNIHIAQKYLLKIGLSRGPYIEEPDITHILWQYILLTYLNFIFKLWVPFPSQTRNGMRCTRRRYRLTP